MALGGIEILLQGGLHPDLGVEWYEDLFRWMKAKWPTINLHALSPEEIRHIARTSELSLGDDHRAAHRGRARLDPRRRRRDPGRRGPRRIAPLKCSTDEWLAVMGAAHGWGCAARPP